MDRNTYNSIREKIEDLEKRLNGGPGSGNFGHAGREGKIGGSAPSGSGGSSKKSDYTKADQIKDFYKAGQITEAERDELLAEAKADGTDKDKVEKPKEKTQPKQSKTQPQKAAEDIYEWGKKNLSYPEDMRHNEKASFDQMLARMYDGDDFYKEFGDIDSVDREKVFDEMAKRTGLDYEDIYNTWLNGHEVGPKLNDEIYKRAIQSKQNVEKYLQSLIESPRLRELNKKGYSKLSKKERDELNLRDMVSSGKDSEYLRKGTSPHTSGEQYANLTEKERKKIVDEEWDYLNKNVESSPAGTDSEGVSYRSLSLKRR